MMTREGDAADGPASPLLERFTAISTLSTAAVRSTPAVGEAASDRTIGADRRAAAHSRPGRPLDPRQRRGDRLQRRPLRRDPEGDRRHHRHREQARGEQVAVEQVQPRPRLDQAAEDVRRDRPADRRPGGVVERDRHPAHLDREDLADGQVGRTRRGRREEEDHRPERRLRGRRQLPLGKQPPGQRQQDRRDPVGRGDHRLPADRVEPVAQRDRPEEVADREREQVQPGPVRGHPVVLGQDQGIGEEDRVVEERLRDHQRQPQKRPRRVRLDHRPRDQAEAEVGPGLEGDRLGRRFERSPRPREVVLDLR